MTITLYNTRTRRKEPFAPIDDKNVRMYVCGPTVYDRAHLGNARPVIVFDVLYRLLRHVYGAGHVTYVRNFTDVDDKINAEAQRRRDAGATEPLEALIRERSNETIAWFLEDMAAVGALNPDEMPRATEYIASMVAMIEDLIAKGHAYAKEGHVLFRVRSYKDYGKLSGRSVDDMIAGARVEVAPFKEDPMDFVLWKPSDAETPGWDSPWGRGRPGWHIECSAMAHDLLGGAFDIHGGGNDLMFPHHENEIAQSKCAGHDFANVWMHNEMLQVEGKKMSKSLGNFFTVRDLLDQGVPGEVIRFVMLSTHYRKPMDWTELAVIEARKTLEKWHSLLGKHIRRLSQQIPDGVVRALSDDLNTPLAIAELHSLANRGDLAELARGAEILGLLSLEQENWFQEPELPRRVKELIEQLVEKRIDAKDRRDYPKADSIRDGLLFAGIQLKDIKGGSEWKYDLVRSANPIHRKLMQLLKEEKHSEFASLMQSLQRDGFDVTHYPEAKDTNSKIVLVVGRSNEQRARLISALEAELVSQLESLK